MSRWHLYKLEVFSGRHHLRMRIVTVLLATVLLTAVIPPPVHAALPLTVTPLTWNVVGLDSNDVTTGPNNFPVGVRACNPDTNTVTFTDVEADFVWLAGGTQNNDTYIRLRPGSLDPIQPNPQVDLDPGACYDFYFEVEIERNSISYDETRRYRIDVTYDDPDIPGIQTVSTLTPREIYVEHLVSQNRNSVLDVKLNGVSIAAGGTMNLLVGSTYTITLVSKTATNGYEQIESFINFPNTIFQILAVSTMYSHDEGTDPDAGTKLYADGCGWVNDPGDTDYRSCTGTGKYGGNVTIDYTVKIIGGGGTNQTLNTLIYDFSGSSYHYNSDYSTSARIANITDPSSCMQSTITQWTFLGDVTTPATGTGSFTPGSNLNTQSFPAGNPADPSLSYRGWGQAETRDANSYYEFAVPTTGYTAIHFNFNVNTSNNNFDKMDVLYSTDGSSYTQYGGMQAISTAWLASNNDLSSITDLNSNANAKFRIYGYSADNSSRTLRVDQVTVTGCALPVSINLDKTITTGNTYDSVSDIISYQYIITNTGGVALTGITLSDDKSTNESCPSTTLVVGASMTCTATYTVTQADLDNGSVTNTATADSNETTAVIDQATATAIQTASLVLTKTGTLNTDVVPPNGVANPGDTITYTFSVQNTGNVTLTNITVTDPLLPTLSCTIASLAPGASASCTATNNVYILTQPDINAGKVDNTATATGKDPSNNDVSDQDSKSVPITQSSALTLVKSITSGNPYSSVGGVISYQYVVTNTGNVPLAGPVTVADDQATDESCPAVNTVGNLDGNLDPGESITCTASHTVTQADINAGSLTNNAQASAGGTNSNIDSETATATQSPALTITKSAIPVTYSAVGQVISYSYTVQNTGNVTILGPFTVSDDNATDESCPATPSLAPGAFIICTASYTVTQTDINIGSVVNSAYATGFFGAQPVRSNTDTETVTYSPSPTTPPRPPRTWTPPSFQPLAQNWLIDCSICNMGDITQRLAKLGIVFEGKTCCGSLSLAAENLFKLIQEKGLDKTHPEEFAKALRLWGDAKKCCEKAQEFYNSGHYETSIYFSNKRCSMYKELFNILLKILGA